jgi:adenosine deaminase
VNRIENLIRRLPKADNHVHFEGLITPELYRSLREQNGLLHLPLAGDVFPACFRDLDHLIDVCRQANAVIQTADDCTKIVTQYLRESQAVGVVHVEIAFEPEFHAQRGLHYEALTGGICRALAWARSKLDISAGLILSFVRDLPVKHAEDTFEQMLRSSQEVIAVGLASRELGNPPLRFRGLFDRARNLGYKLTAHAGEEGPPDYIWQVITEMGVDRIDHGLRAIHDLALLKTLRERCVPVALCPISNIATKNNGDRPSYPFVEILRAGLRLSLNSDDPGIIGRGLEANYRWAAQQDGVRDRDLICLAQNSITSSFMEPAMKRKWLGVSRRIAEQHLECFSA